MLILNGPHRTSYLKYKKPIDMFIGGVQFRTVNQCLSCNSSFVRTFFDAAC